MKIYSIYANRLYSLDVKATKLFYITATRKREFEYNLRFPKKSCFLSPLEAIRARFVEEKKYQKELASLSRANKKTLDALIKLEEKYDETNAD